MKLPRPLVMRLSPLVEAASGSPLVEPFLEVVAADESGIDVDSSHGRFRFDLAARQVRRGDEVVAAFDAIQSVDIGAFPGGRGERSWSVSLYLSPLRRITIGRTYDDGDASVIASGLAQAIGCKVIALTFRR